LNKSIKCSLNVESFFKLRSSNYENETTWVTNEEFLSPLLPRCIEHGKVLDLCAGTGQVAKYFMNLGFDVTATDISLDMLEKLDPKIKFIVADAHDLPFENNSFNLVTCRQGLHYLDLELAFNSIIRISDRLISLGHITTQSKEDVELWEKYFSIAAPCRKEVFYPGQLCEVGEKYGLTVLNVNVIMKSEGLFGPIAYLDNESRKELIAILSKASESFKKRNQLESINGKLFSLRRWEFIVFAKGSNI